MSPQQAPLSAEAWAQHESFVRRLTRCLVADPNDADDLAQDTWLRALRRQPEPGMGLRPWLAATARGLASNQMRGRTRRGRRERSAARAESTADPLEHLALRQEVIAAVLDLDEPFRQVVVMTYEQGLGPREIAASLGLPAATVRSRLHRAHGKLRAQLQTNDEGGLERYAVLALPRAGSVPSWLVGAGFLACSGLVAGVLLVRGGSPPAASSPRGARILAVGSAAASRLSPLEPALDSKAQDPASAPVRRPLEEHPYWQAVRAARKTIPAYRPEESETTRELRARLAKVQVHGLRPMDGVHLNVALDSIAEALGAPIVLSPAALAASLDEAQEAHWIVRGPVTARDALDLVCGLAGDGVDWELRQGSVRVETPDELLRRTSTFAFGIGDLLLDPADFYGSEIPAPVFALPHSAGDLLTILMEAHPGYASQGPETTWELVPGAVQVRSTPRVLVDIQGRLTRLRSFRLPLPEEGVPGATQRTPGSLANPTVVQALRSAGGPAGLRPAAGEAPLDPLRRLAEAQGLALLRMGDGSQTLPADYQLIVAAGCLWVTGPDHFVPLNAIEELHLDLRQALKLPPEDLPADPTSPWPARLAEVDREGDHPWWLENTVRTHVSPESWDSNPANTLRITQDLELIVHQGPLALDQVLELVAYLRSGQ